MNHQRLWIAAAIIAFVLIAGFVISVPHTRDVADTSELENKADNIPLVTLHDSFKKGVHTITGSINAPNECTIVTANAILGTDEILIALSVPEDSGVCLQLPARINFSATISAPANLPIKATVNDLTATTTMI